MPITFYITVSEVKERKDCFIVKGVFGKYSNERKEYSDAFGPHTAPEYLIALEDAECKRAIVEVPKELTSIISKTQRGNILLRLLPNSQNVFSFTDEKYACYRR